MLTEFKGPAWRAMAHEMASIGLWPNVYRIWYELARRVGLHRGRYDATPVSDEELYRELGGAFRTPEEILGHLRQRSGVRFFFSHHDRSHYAEILNDRFADQRARCLELADEVCRHRFELMGTTTDFGPTIDWHRLLGTDQSWPRAHWSSINIRCPDALGEIKTTWELNRHQFWLHLGRAYWFTGDEKYAREWAAQVRSWLDQNPREIGVNWYSNLELAIRAVSWLWSLEFFLDSPAVDGPLVRDMMRTFLAMGRHLRQDIAYSLHVMPSNHLLGDAMGLVFIGICLPEFRQARRWRDYGLKVLYDWLTDQVRPDGTSIEQSLSYHRFVLYFYLLTERLTQLNGLTPPDEVETRSRAMIDVLASVLRPDRSVPPFGDTDDARTVILTNDLPQCYLPTLSTGAVRFRRGDWKTLAGSLSEETFWLLGPEAPAAWDDLPAEKPEAGPRSFPDGGIYVSRDSWRSDGDFLMVRCGPFTGHRTAGLGHLDLSAAGQNLLAAAGTYTYNGPWAWRTWFRQSSAHNTVTVDGHGQALSHRSFRFLVTPREMRGTLQPLGDAVRIDVSHRSFRFLDGGLRHRRIVHAVHGRFYLVIDLLDGRGRHEFAQHWHFEPGPLELDDRGAAARPLGPDRRFVVIPMARPGLNWSLIEGSTDPIQGWRSPSFGRKEPAPCLTYCWSDACPTRMVTLLAVASAGDAPSLTAVEGGSGRPATVLRVEVGGAEYLIECS